MVFFCGAGVSVPTGIPGFRGLVQQLYSRLNTSPTSSEKRALDRSEFDTALDSLEARFNPGTMREEVVRLLTVPPSPEPLRLHRALLEVARTPSGLHLVTTNYDDNFARAYDADDLQFDVGPNVPTDLDNWNSVVHLHGRVQASASAGATAPLVLTDTDFGEAYLRRRWAAEFVLSLMDRYTVVFVGYSMADVVVRYLAKAVSGRRARNRIYSLVGYTDQIQREQRASQWQAHRIEPILYNSRDGHELLVRSVEEWARLSQDPHGYRVHLAVSGLSGAPDRGTHATDPERVVWALKDPAAAWPAFNQLRRDPVPGPEAAAWLHEFARRGLLEGTVSPKQHERGPAGPMITGRVEQQMLQTDSVAQAATIWIEIHAHAPAVFKWVIEHGRSLHFELRRRLWDRLTAADQELPEIPPRLIRLWTLLLAEPPDDYEFLLRLDPILSSLSGLQSEATDDILLRLLRPRLGVFPGPAPYRTSASGPEGAALQECAHTDVVLGCHDRSHGFNVLTEVEPSRFPGFLVRHAVVLTEYLRSALHLVSRSDQLDARFIHFQSGDAEMNADQQRRLLHEFVGAWTLLLDWVRESYRALPQGDTRREDLLRSWIASDETTLRRLALETIAQDDDADFDLAGRILLGRPHGLLLDDACSQEVLSVLRRVGARGSRELQAKLAEAIQLVLTADEEPDSGGASLAGVESRLEALDEGGMSLPPEALKFLAKHRERRGAARQHESQATPVLTGPIRCVVDALQHGTVDPEAFERFVRKRPVAGLVALERLGHAGQWPMELWKRALRMVRTRVGKSGSRHGSRLAELLLRIPDDLFSGIHSELSWLLGDLAEHWSRDDDTAFWHLWGRGWAHRSLDSADFSRTHALMDAMNTTAGRYADAALKRIRNVRAGSSGPIADRHLSILDQLARDESGPSGLLILASWLNWLYVHAPEWTTESIVSRMRWGQRSPADGRSEEVRMLWEVMAVRGSLTPDLVRALGPDLWTAVRRHKEFADGENLVRLFIYVSTWDQPRLIEQNDCRQLARIVVRDKPLQVGVALREVLKRNPGPADLTWRETVRPWLEHYWPREKALNTAESSTALVDVIMETGDAFPDAVEWANGYLTPLNEQIGSVWYHKRVWKEHPRAALALLHRIVPSGGVDPWARSSLTDMLRGLREVDSTLPRDSRFVELERRAAH